MAEERHQPVLLALQLATDARLDDAVNFIPARLAGGLIASAAVALPKARAVRAWRSMLRDAPRHRSPNAGWPEAAMASILGVALSGPRVYADGPTEDPYVNPEGRRDIGAADIERAVGALWRAWAALLILALVFSRV